MKNEEGVTLIELILVIAIAGILSTAIYGAFFASNKVMDFNKEKVNIQQDHRVIVNQLAPYLRMARTVTIKDAYGSAEDKIRLYFTVIDADPDYTGIGFGIKDGNELYYRKKREVVQEDGTISFEWGNRMTFITSKVTKFEVSEDDNMITITVELEEKDGDTYTFVDEFFRRIP